MEKMGQQEQLQAIAIIKEIESPEPQTLEEILETQKLRTSLFQIRKLSPVLEMLIRNSGDQIAQLKTL